MNFRPHYNVVYISHSCLIIRVSRLIVFGRALCWNSSRTTDGRSPKSSPTSVMTKNPTRSPGIDVALFPHSTIHQPLQSDQMNVRTDISRLFTISTGTKCTVCLHQQCVLWLSCISTYCLLMNLLNYHLNKLYKAMMPVEAVRVYCSINVSMPSVISQNVV